MDKTYQNRSKTFQNYLWVCLRYHLQKNNFSQPENEMIIKNKIKILDFHIFYSLPTMPIKN